MGTLIENLSQIESIKGEIRSAIESKGVDMTGKSFPDYPGAIASISTGAFVTETLSTTVNGTFYPGTGVDGFSEVIVNVSGGGGGVQFKDIIEGNYYSAELIDGTISRIHYGALARYINYDVPPYDILTSIPITYFRFENCSLVGNYAFRYQDQLSSFSLPACQYVGPYAFADCTALTEISMSAVQSIGACAFNNCTSIARISLPACQYIEVSAFSGCTALTEISMSAVKSIGASAFKGCTSLTRISLPACQYLDPQAFSGCTALTEIYLPVCEEIASHCFDSAAITTLNLPSVEVIRSLAFAYCSELSQISIPLCRTLENAVFSGCTLLASVGTLSNLEGVGTGTFSGCNIQSISLPKCSMVGSQAFLGNVNLSYVYISGSVLTIYMRAFSGCTNLSTVVLAGSYVATATSAMSVIFPGTKMSTGGAFYVNDSYYSQYLTAKNWSNWKSYIHPMSEMQ